LLIKYIKRVLWRVAKRLSYIEDARCLKFKVVTILPVIIGGFMRKIVSNRTLTKKVRNSSVYRSAKGYRTYSGCVT